MNFALRARLWKRTSIRQNLSANLISKVLQTAVTIACVPIYLQLLGVAAYGLIGIWTVLETLASLLDLGLSPAMTRELAASTHRGAEGQDAAHRRKEVQDTRDLVRTLEVAYCGLGVLVGAALILAASPIASYWLRSSQLSPKEVSVSVVLIGVLILCRWPLSFYSAGLTGLERQVLLSWMGFAFAFVRNLGAVFVLVFVSPTILAFFVWQIAVNLAQTGTVAALFWRCMPPGRTPRFRPKNMRRIWRFAGGLTAVALVSMLTTNLDKLVVSTLVPLEEFGYYTLGARVAGTLYMASSSVFIAMFPAFTRLAVAQDETRLAELYHRGSQMMSVLVLPAAVTAAFFAKPLIFAWTGSQLIADQTALIAALLTIGTAFNCVVTTPYALQLAHGWTSLAFWTNLASLPVMVLLLIVFIKLFGAVGAAGIWIVVNAGFLITQVPLMHRRLLKHEVRRWYVQDFGIPFVACAVTAALIAEAAGSPATRLDAAVTVIIAGGIIGAVGLFATPLIRKQIRELMKMSG
jgi:O-antigen/teichoic acid export membrane protein